MEGENVLAYGRLPSPTRTAQYKTLDKTKT